MFIVTMVFLVSLIFTVQQTLFQYVAVDTADVYDNYDIYLLNNLRDIFDDTLQLSPDCVNATVNIQNLGIYLDQPIFRDGYVVDFGGTLNSIDCSNWGTADPVVVLELKITRGVDTQTEAEYPLFR